MPHACGTRARGVNDNDSAMSMTPHAFCCVCGVNFTSCSFENYNFFPNSNLYLKRFYPLNQGPRMDVLMKKKPRVENLVTLSL
jgi:hypothetical protein